MKKLKKVGAVVTLACMMTVSLAGCAKKTECEGCGEKKKCNKYEAELLGESETGWFCSDCADEMESYIEMFGGTFKKK